MPRKKTKLILDTNFWVSYLITDKLKYLDETLFGNTVQLVFSEELIVYNSFTERKIFEIL